MASSQKNLVSHIDTTSSQNVYSDDAETGGTCCECFLKALSFILCIFTFPVCLCFCIKAPVNRSEVKRFIISSSTKSCALDPWKTFQVEVYIVQEYERAVLFRLGRVLPGAKGPGMFFILPCIDDIYCIDMRTVSFDVPPQEILTKDSVTVAVDAVVYYKINNPMISVCNVENAPTSTRLLAQTTLRNILGSKTLSEILSERDNISASMQEILDVGTDPWGVKVERVEVKDVRLPVQLQRAMATEAEAAREARAKVVAAEGEMKASRALKEASDIISESESALQLRYLQTLTQISAEKNSTIIFPLPIDLLGGMVKTKSGIKGTPM